MMLPLLTRQWTNYASVSSCRPEWKVLHTFYRLIEFFAVILRLFESLLLGSRTLVDLASPCSGSRLDLLHMDHPIGLVEAANNQDLLAHVFLRLLLIIKLVSNVVCAS